MVDISERNSVPNGRVEFATFAEQVSETLSGSAQSQLPINRLSRILFLIPPICRQKQIAAEMNTLRVQLDALKKLQTETAAELDALLPSILDKAFKGEL